MNHTEFSYSSSGDPFYPHFPIKRLFPHERMEVVGGAVSGGARRENTIVYLNAGDNLNGVLSKIEGSGGKILTPQNIDRSIRVHRHHSGHGREPGRNPFDALTEIPMIPGQAGNASVPCLPQGLDIGNKSFPWTRNPFLSGQAVTSLRRFSAPEPRSRAPLKSSAFPIMDRKHVVLHVPGYMGGNFTRKVIHRQKNKNQSQFSCHFRYWGGRKP